MLRSGVRYFARYAAAMSTRKVPPADPTLVILGSTGTGKSDLAVELARRFNGEVVNADAMQMYRGLPIITNKISAAEQRGVPHHLLGNIDLEDEAWNVGLFRREAERVICEIRGRGKLPIVVGGTHYYIDGLLFDHHLVEDGPDTEEAASSIPADAVTGSSTYPILDGPTEAMLARLREVDPVMADKWHPNDRRKIRRSLEIYLATGRRASDIYAEQQEAKKAKASRARADAASSPRTGPWQSLLLWVYSQPEALNERLDRRVDAMLARGLADEVQQMHDYLHARLAAGQTVDRTKGVWQSIGFKELEPYLEGLQAKKNLGLAATTAAEEELQKLRDAGLESMKAATRRYAKSQVRWVTHKTLRLIREEDEQAQQAHLTQGEQGAQGGQGALSHLFLLDSTDASRWSEQVASVATTLVARFLAGDPLPPPLETSPTAREVLSRTLDASGRGTGTPCRRTCEVCDATLLTEELWQRHLGSHRHRRALRHRSRTALVPVPMPVRREGEEGEEGEGEGEGEKREKGDKEEEKDGG